MEKTWSNLYKEAKKRINVQTISPFIETGNISCAIESANNNLYFGINIATNTDLHSSAEKNAITMLINSGENKIKKMVILNELEELIPPSEDCMEYLLELCDNPEDTEILINYEKKEIVSLSDLIPSWWGTYRNKKN